jgi:hypothetical protein
MMSKTVDRALEEFFDFISKYELSSLLEDKNYKTSVKSIYRRYHSLLIWQADLSGGNIWSNVAKEKEFCLYFSEAVSDICHSFLLFCHGMYKAANLVMRVAIEAFIKAVGLAGDQKVLTITSLFEVFNIVSSVDIIKNNTLCSRCFQKIHQDYIELCNYVHIASPSYMSLTSATGAFPKFCLNESKDFEKRIKETIVSICSIFAIMFNNRFKAMHHSSIDIILDILPKKARREIMNFTA